MDARYKQLYSVPRMVEDLVRAVAPGIAKEVDFATLEDLSAETVGTRGQQRRGDKVWRVRLRDSRRHVILLLEFQSDKSSGIMPLRMLEYAALQLVQLHRKDDLGAAGEWPAVLPIVVYSDAAPWNEPVEVRDLFAPVDAALRPHLPSQRMLLLDAQRANEDDMPRGNLTRAVVGFEKSSSPADLVRVAEPLDGWLGDEDKLRGIFVDWIQEMTRQLQPPGAPPNRAIRTLEDARMTIVERIAEWPKPWIEKGIVQGREQGIVQGREQGIEQGFVQGQEQGLADQRALLRRQATLRFGGAVGDRVAAALANVADAERLADVGEWIVSCSTADELDARLAELPSMPVNGMSPARRH